MNAQENANASQTITSGILGDYRLLREVGRGGMGVVYEAEQISLGRKVALKVLPFAAMLDSRQIQRFQNEARAAASLRHPNIVQIYAVGCERAVHFYAMEYVEGRTVADIICHLRAASGSESSGKGILGLTNFRDLSFWCRFRQRPLHSSLDDSTATAVFSSESSSSTSRSPEPEQSALSTDRSGKMAAYFHSVTELSIHVAEALHHAHERGVIHRDIKPSNIIVDGTGKPWITDFGLARIDSDATLTISGDLMGTVRFMSPEQTKGIHAGVDHRTDIYSLGVMLYELLTFRPAIPGKGHQELIQRINLDEPLAPRKLVRSVPEELETITLKALAKSPDERYATAQELAEDLRRFVNYEPILARRPTVSVRLRKWVRRHRLLTMNIVVIALLMVALPTLFFGWRYQHLDHLRRHADDVLLRSERDMAQHAYGQAVSRLEMLKIQIVHEPVIWSDYGVRIGAGLHRSQAQRQFQQFQQNAAKGRFAAHASAIPNLYVSHERKLQQLKQARSDCLAALAVYDVLNTRDVVDMLTQLKLDASQRDTLSLSISETLVLLAHIDFELSNQMPRNAEEIASGIDLLTIAEDLVPNLRSVYELRAQLREAAGQIEAAAQDAERAAELEAAGWLDHFLMGKSRFSEADYHGALRHFEAALSTRVNDFWTWYYWGKAHQWLGDTNRTAWAMDICVRLRPQEVVAWLGRGEALELLDDFSGARAAFATALTLTRDPSLRSAAYFGRANVNRHQGKFDDSIADIDRALEYFPDATWYLVIRAQILTNKGETELAVADAKRVLDLLASGSRSWHAHHRLFAWRVLQNWEKVIREAQTLIDQEPSPEQRAAWQFELAAAQGQLRRFEEATATLCDVATIVPPEAMVPHWNKLAWNLVKHVADPKQLNLALELATSAVEANPKSSTSRRILGIALCRSRRYEDSISALEQAIRLSKTAGTAWEFFFLAIAHGHIGSRDQAEQWYDKAIAWMEEHDSVSAELAPVRSQARQTLDSLPKEGSAADVTDN